MASIVVASITAVPLVLLVWDLTRHKDKAQTSSPGRHGRRIRTTA